MRKKQLTMWLLFFVTHQAYSLEIIRVTAVEGGTAVMPCDFHHPKDDSVFLILWFNGNLTTPIYSYDLRPGVGGTHWVDETVLGTRASLDVTKSPAKFRLLSVTSSDAGLYKCRVDFRRQPTKTTRVNLGVVLPPTSVSVVSEGRPVTSVVGPYRVGETAFLTCVAHGGNPPPTILWFIGGQLIDNQMDEDPPTNTLPPGPTNTLLQTPSFMFTQGRPSLLTQGPTRAYHLRSASFFVDKPTHLVHRRSTGILQRSETLVKNTLTIGPFVRNDLKKLLTCEVTNTNLTSPLTAAVMIDMNLEPVNVQLFGPEGSLSYGKKYEVVCEVRGSRPPPTITWWKGATRVQGAHETTTSDGNLTSSILTLEPKPHDDGTTVTCRAENPATSTVLEQSLPMAVYYVPEAVITLGSSLNPKNIKESDDVYFECSIMANPRAYKVTWQHNGGLLQHNITSGIIVSNQSLVLQGVTRKHGGQYSCTVSNIEGDGISKAIVLDIKYAPVCALGQVTTYGVARHEDAEVTCRVAANPAADGFKWTFNNTADTIDVPAGRFTSEPTYSIITYTPMTELDYGTLLCWADNKIGQQTEPCVFHIVPAGKPDPPANCSVSNQTSTSFRVACQAGFDGGLHQMFILTVAQPGTQGRNITTGHPVFQVAGLTPDTTYRLQIWAANDKGASPYVHLRAFTTQPPSHHHTAHVVAEVREGNSDNTDGSIPTGGGGGGGPGGGSSTSANSLGNQDSSVRLDSQDDHGMRALVSVVVGASVGILFLIFLLVLLVRKRVRRPHPPPPPIPSHSITPTSPTSILKPSRDTVHTCSSEREMQVESESEMDPDLIPQQLIHSTLTPSGPLLRPPANYGGSETPFGEASPLGIAGGGLVAGGGAGGGGGGNDRGPLLVGAVGPGGAHHPHHHLFQPYHHPSSTANTTSVIHQPHLLPQHHYQQSFTNDPRYAHLDLDDGGHHHNMPNPGSRMVPTVYATLNPRQSQNRVTFDLRQSQSQASLEIGRSCDLGYGQGSRLGQSSNHSSSHELGYGPSTSQLHDPSPNSLEENTAPDTPLVSKRESSV